MSFDHHLSISTYQEFGQNDEIDREAFLKEARNKDEDVNIHGLLLLDHAALLKEILPKTIPAQPVDLTKKQADALKKVPKREIASRSVTSLTYLLQSPKALLNPRDLANITFWAANGALTGAFLGGGIGALIGAGAVTLTVTTVAIITNINSDLKSPEFRTFSILRQEVLRARLMDDFLLGDEILQYFVCPISHKIPAIPLTFDCSNKNNIHFDLEAISKWLDTKPNKAPPLCKYTFTYDQLKLDLPCINSIISRLPQLIRTCLNREEVVQKFQRLPNEFPFNVKEIIIGFVECDTSKINKVLIHIIEVCDNFTKQRNEFAIDKIKQIHKKKIVKRVSGVKAGWELRKLHQEMTKIKVPFISTPWCFCEPKLLGFSVNSDYVEEQSNLGEDIKIMKCLLTDLPAIA